MRLLQKAIILTLVAPALTGLVACTSSSDHPLGTSSPSQSGTASTTSSDVSFMADGTKTYGTLETPAHRSGARLAAALLIPGSGPTDRDGNDSQLGLTAGTLKLIADILAKQGIMSLRFDKYFAGKTGAGRFASDPGDITISAFFKQADDAYEFLGKEPVADPAKLLVVGHSEGGMIALNVAASEATKPAGLALLEPQDIRFLNLVRIQADEAINGLVAQGALTADQARTSAMAVVRAFGQFRAGQSVSTDGMAPQIVQILKPLILTPDNAKGVRTNDQIVPATLAAKVKAGTRVLFTVGTRDANVPTTTTGPLMTALSSAGTTGPGLTVLQGTDHLMHLSNQPATTAVLAPALVSAFQQWAAPFASVH